MRQELFLMRAILSTFLSQIRNRIPNLLKINIPEGNVGEGIMFELISL
jgi:hypothetical protein